MSPFDQHIEKLLEFLRIPSISSLPEYANDMVLAAQFLEQELEGLGFDVSFHWPKGKESTPPLVFAERISGNDLPTVLTYGHYDVQPATPLEAWLSDPFEPEIRDGKIYARGASDDKGQIITQLAALKELGEEWGNSWPINVKIIFEGQEEQGSPGMQKWLEEEEAQKLLKADVALITDCPMIRVGLPTIMCSLRGIMYFKVVVKTANEDMHSGTFGGAILNSAAALSYIFSQLIDVTTGKVMIPGFYEGVEYTDKDREELKKIPFSEEEFLKQAQNAKAIWGNKEFTPKERITMQPTLDIMGMWSGDLSEATKTAIPASAYGKFSCRVVAGQNLEKLSQNIINFIHKLAPKEAEVKVEKVESGNGLRVDLNSPWLQKVGNVLSKVFEQSTVFDREGASIPAVASMQQKLGLDPVIFGYALHEDYHVPNEKFSVEYFKKGIEANKLIYKSFAEK